MSVDNRTILNDCEDSAQTFTTSGGALATETGAGGYYEGVASVRAQHSNNNDRTSTTGDSAGATFNIDMSDMTVYLLAKDNLVSPFGESVIGNGGAQIVLGDGTNLIGYPIGGNDAVGMPISQYFTTFKLDVSEVVATPPTNVAVYTGTEAALVQTAITAFGYGSVHPSKAVGNIANLWLDVFAYIANTSYALTINGGTVGTPETMLDVQGDDELNGWGLVANPLGAQYQFFSPTEWGNAAAVADVYFTASDEQWFWIGDNAGGHPVGITHFPFRIVGNATDTIDIKWSNLVIVNTGTRAEFIAGDTNVDIMQFDNVTFTDLGAITFPVLDTGNKFADNCSFNNCAQVDPSTTAMDGPSFNGTTDANGALLIAASVSNIIGATFTSDGTGHAIYITATGTYDFDFWTFSPNYGADGTTDAVVYNNSGGAVTINILNSGDTPTVLNGAAASTIINNSVTVSVTGVTEGAAVVVVANETVGTITIGDVILETLADANGEATTTINYESAFAPSGLDVITRCRASGLPTAAIQDDGGVFTDQTTAANQANTLLMNLLPSPATIGDNYLWGHVEKFGKLKLDINTAGTGGFTITWEYWNGATWAALANVTDGTSSFSIAGLGYIEFDIPGDWATTTINTTQGPYYYIRSRFSAGTVTISPTGTRSSLDVTKYLPFFQDGIILSTGLSVTASWNEDTIATF